jgi:hypothetical protein
MVGVYGETGMLQLPGQPKEIEALEMDEGRYLGYVRLVGRRQSVYSTSRADRFHTTSIYQKATAPQPKVERLLSVTRVCLLDGPCEYEHFSCIDSPPGFNSDLHLFIGLFDDTSVAVINFFSLANAVANGLKWKCFLFIHPMPFPCTDVLFK